MAGVEGKGVEESGFGGGGPMGYADLRRRESGSNGGGVGRRDCREGIAGIPDDLVQ